jgi:hypothetical protein
MKNYFSVSFLLFIGFLVIGYSVSTLLYRANYTGTAVAQTNSAQRYPSIQTLENGQRSILLVVVDKIAPSESKLTGLWLITYLPTDPTMNLFPILPSGNNSVPDNEQRFYQTFSLTTENGHLGLDKVFIEELTKNNYWWSGYVIVDQAALQMINESAYLAGGDLKLADLMGMNFDPDNPLIDRQTAYFAQVDLAQTLCDLFSKSLLDANWSNIEPVILDHVYTDLDSKQLAFEWETVFTNGQNLKCIFPTLQVFVSD